MVGMSEKALQEHIKKHGQGWWDELSERQREWVRQKNKEAAEQAQTWWEELPKKERARYEKDWVATTKRNHHAREATPTPADLDLLRSIMQYGMPDMLAHAIGMMSADFLMSTTSKQTSTAAAKKPKPAWHAEAKREAERLIASGTSPRNVAAKIARMQDFSRHDIKTIRAALK